MKRKPDPKIAEAVRALKARLAEIKRQSEERRRRQVEEEEKQMVAKSEEIRRLSETELAMRRAENKQKGKLIGKPTRVDPIDERKIGWAELR